MKANLKQHIVSLLNEAIRHNDYYRFMLIYNTHLWSLTKLLTPDQLKVINNRKQLLKDTKTKVQDKVYEILGTMI